MSHVTACQVEIKDLAELKRACETLGLTFCEGQTKFAWYGRWVGDYHAADAAVTQGYDVSKFGQCLHAIKLPGCKYEIGVVPRVDGKGLTLMYDHYGQGQAITKALGHNCEKLVQRYNANSATASLKRRGYKVVERLTTNGTIRLETL